MQPSCRCQRLACHAPRLPALSPPPPLFHPPQLADYFVRWWTRDQYNKYGTKCTEEPCGPIFYVQVRHGGARAGGQEQQEAKTWAGVR